VRRSFSHREEPTFNFLRESLFGNGGDIVELNASEFETQSNVEFNIDDAANFGTTEISSPTVIDVNIVIDVNDTSHESDLDSVESVVQY